jgi:hypothetical protein
MTPSACGKDCGIENRVRNPRQERPSGRFQKDIVSVFKSMNSNQLCNSPDINMVRGEKLLISFRI